MDRTQLRLNTIKFIQNGGDLNQFPYIWETIFRHGDLDLVQYVMEQELDIPKLNKTLVKTVATVGRLDVLKLLMAFGVDIDNHSDQMLLNAVENGNNDMVKFLVENGANVHVHPPHASLLYRPASEGNVELVRYLLEHGVNDNDSRYSSSWVGCITLNKPEVAKLLLEYGMDPRQDYHYPFYCAIDTNQIEILKLMLEYGFIPTEPIWVNFDDFGICKLFDQYHVSYTFSMERRPKN